MGGRDVYLPFCICLGNLCAVLSFCCYCCFFLIMAYFPLRYLSFHKSLLFFYPDQLTVNEWHSALNHQYGMVAIQLLVRMYNVKSAIAQYLWKASWEAKYLWENFWMVSTALISLNTLIAIRKLIHSVSLPAAWIT